MCCYRFFATVRSKFDSLERRICVNRRYFIIMRLIKQVCDDRFKVDFKGSVGFYVQSIFESIIPVHVLVEKRARLGRNTDANLDDQQEKLPQNLNECVSYVET